jgi:hypothetical protein
MTLVTLWGALLSLTVLAQAQEQRIGTVVGVPLIELDAFAQANAMPGVDSFGRLLVPNSVRVLHVSREFNSGIATVAVTRRGSSQPAIGVYFPTYGNGDMSRLYEQINANDFWTHPQLFGRGSQAVLKVNVVQQDPGTFVPGGTRFLLVPWASVNSIIAANRLANIRLVHNQRALIGAGNLNVELLAVDPSSALHLRIPDPDVARLILRLNPNVATQNGAVGGGSTITTLTVR